MPGVLLCCSASQAHRGDPLGGLPWRGSYSVDRQVRHLMGQPLYCSATDAGSVGREGLWRWLHPLHMTQCYGLASMASQLSSTGISYHNLLLHISSVCLSAISSSPLPWDCSTIPKLQLPAAAPSRGPASLSGYVWLWQGLPDSHSI